MQRQQVRDRAAGVLLGEGVEAFRQQAAVEDLLKLRDPGDMKRMEDAGFNAPPVMHGHGQSS